jgi:HK97 family phage major capsid protein
MSTTQSELRLASLLDEREQNHKLHETVIASVEASDTKMPSESQTEQITMYREKAVSLDAEIDQLAEDVERNRKAVEASKAIRRALAGRAEGVDVDDDGIVYRTMASYARDVILTGQGREVSKIGAQLGADYVESARERLQLLKRTPANTLSSNVAGLTPDQHIAQIFQVIQTERPIVASAQRTTLERGTLTYPVITQRPVVAVQSSEKTEAGNTGMIIDMVTTNASTYLGGGDLSWQAINWSTPDALEMWFRLAASDYALKTEQDAAQAVQHSGFTYNISSTLAALTDFNDVVTAIAAGAGDVYANSGRMADTIYMAPNAFFSLAGISGPDSANFVNTGLLNLSAQGGTLAGLAVVVSRGMDTGVIVVGDSDGLLVAETAGAPVELRVVEPAIGGVEVGIIGAFEAVVVDPGAFAMITTAS